MVALSTPEAEYVAAIEASKDMIWLKSFMEELGKIQNNSYLLTNSESAIHLAKNYALHSKTKHIQLRYHFIRSVLDDGQLLLEKIHTDENPADMFTKAVTREKLTSSSTSPNKQTKTCRYVLHFFSQFFLFSQLFRRKWRIASS